MNTSLALSINFVRASRVLARVYAGASLAESGALEPAVQDLCYGTLRDYAYLDALIGALLHKPIAEPEVRALLACAMRELQRERVTAFTAVNEAVSACVELGYPAAKGLVNAVLRNYLRQKEAIEAAALREEPARWRHPQWWINALKKAYPESWTAILQAGNEHPPMNLRVNIRRQSPEAYALRLEEAGILAHRFGEVGFRLETPCPMAQLPGYAAGEVSVQDAGAQHAAVLLDTRTDMRVLDACAAPGGKTAHILERADVALLALDRDADRVARAGHNLLRLGLKADVLTADAAAIESWWDGRLFDRILLDVPCSASGIVRRHPDIKWLRRPEDLQNFAAQQRRLLDALWRVLAPGGKLLYVTCSVFPRENVQQVESFLQRQPEAGLESLTGALPADGQLLPDAQHDGFYYALLNKMKSVVA